MYFHFPVLYIKLKTTPNAKLDQGNTVVRFLFMQSYIMIMRGKQTLRLKMLQIDMVLEARYYKRENYLELLYTLFNVYIHTGM